jgi:phosphate transport system permease protein
MLVTAAVAIPTGIAAGVYLEEYAPKNRWTAFIEINIANLAGVPSILYGLMALGLFVYYFKFGQSILSGGLALACLVLPIVIVATRESLRSIPSTIREAAFALGATRWQAVWHHLLPYSTGGIATGVILAMSRAIGESAPLITIGALTFIAFLPPAPVVATPPFVSFDWLFSPYSALPIQMFNWVSRPGEEFHANAAAAGLVLMVITLSMNGAAILIRRRAQRNIHW